MRELQNLETSRKIEDENELFPAEQLHKGLYARKKILEHNKLWEVPARRQHRKPHQKPALVEQPKL